MAELRESSLLFSLESLLSHERERVDLERRAADEQRVALEAERILAERLGAEAEARREAEARELAAREAARRREEEARLEGIRRAEIERATAEARLRSELELAARKNEHDLRVAALDAGGRARTFGFALLATGMLATVALVAALVLEFAVRRPELSRLRTSLHAELLAERARTEQLQTLLLASEARARQLADTVERRAREPAPAAAPTTVPAPANPSPPRARPPSRSAGPRERRPCTGNPDDPLNPCL